eukprot:1154203-Pelagomonas_calceolata.AAC.4
MALEQEGHRLCRSFRTLTLFHSNNRVDKESFTVTCTFINACLDCTYSRKLCAFLAGRLAGGHTNMFGTCCLSILRDGRLVHKLILLPLQLLLMPVLSAPILFSCGSRSSSILNVTLLDIPQLLNQVTPQHDKDA